MCEEKVLMPYELYKGMYVTVYDMKQPKGDGNYIIDYSYRGDILKIKEIMLPYIILDRIVFDGAFDKNIELDTRYWRFIPVTENYMKQCGVFPIEGFQKTTDKKLSYDEECTCGRNECCSSDNCCGYCTDVNYAKEFADFKKIFMGVIGDKAKNLTKRDIDDLYDLAVKRYFL